MSPSHAHKAFHQFSFKALLLHMYEPNDIYLRQVSNIKQVGKRMEESRDNARSKTELQKQTKQTKQN